MIRIYPRFAVLAVAASLAVSLGTLAATATPAYAADAASTGARTAAVRVAYDDLNLQSAVGLRRLDARVRAAAERLCIPNGLTSLRERAAADACKDEALAAARPQVRRATRVQPLGAVLLAARR